MKKTLLVTVIACLFVACTNKNEVNLAGKWSVVLHESARKDTLFKPSRGLGPTQNVMYQPTVLNSEAKTEGVIKLPATLDEYGFGNKVEEPFLGCLSRKTQFIGEAVYSRKIKTPETASWRIVFERVLWKSTLKIDGKTIGSCESLSTPHTFVVSNLSEGEHLVEVTVDNTMIHRIGEKGHAYGEHMQTIWNGILGKMLMQKIDAPVLKNVRINAPFERNRLELFFDCDMLLSNLTLQLSDKNTGKILLDENVEFTINGERIEISVPLQPDDFVAWSEFSPQLYTLELRSGKQTILKKNIGFRSFKREGNQLFVNGEPLFLRGNLDNCHFPLTGYPSTKKEDWLRILSVQKSYGCNNIRFHSYCPPEAAFEAADELGLYLAPEVGVWIDGWMPGQITALGKDNYDLNAYIKSELLKICDTYGSHASFAMLGIGNELGSSNFDSLQLWVDEVKRAESFENTAGWQSRLYTISTARTLTPVDDYFVTHYYPNIGGVRQWMFPHTDWSYEELYGRTTTPTVAHEIGQWPVYPDWNEISKYTGVLAPRNLQALKQHAAENGVLRFNKQFHFASGMQSRLMYKDEIESFMRTPSCRGIHLLGMQDYSGQGEALIGFLDSFYEPKGFWSDQEVKGCFAPVVTLAEFEKYGWKSTETFTAELLVRNQQCDFEQASVLYQFFDENGKLIKEGTTDTKKIKNGELADFGQVALDLKPLAGNKITLVTTLVADNGFRSDKNSWSVWVFPEQEVVPTATVLLTANLDTALYALEHGQNVLLDASQLGNEGRYLKGDWGSVYWSTTWFPGQQMQTLGVWFDKQHPVFEAFHSEGFADWIWWKIFEHGRCFDLKGLSGSYCPMAMPVPDFHNNQLLGSIFELRVGNANLLVSGYSLQGDAIEQIVFRNELVRYAESSKFAPKESVSVQWLNELLNPNAAMTSCDLPEEFKGALLYVECGARAAASSKWEKNSDRCVMADNVDYNIEGFAISKRNDRFVWTTDAANKIEISTPAGELGMLHVEFVENGVTGEVEERRFDTKDADSAVLPIDREDCLDGKLVLRLDAAKRAVSIKRLVFVPIKK